MSKFLSIEHDPVDQPAAADPVERRTWGALRLRVGGRTITRIWDRLLEEERSFLYVPGFPIAAWLVQNWWPLLYEPRRMEFLPRGGSFHLPWVRRHCLRTAESSLLLPALHLFNNGSVIQAVWQADEPGSLPNMPGEFIASGEATFDIEGVMDELGRFVSAMLARVEDIPDERVQNLKELLRTVRSADPEEKAFCIAAGRLGLNPYDPNMSEEITQVIEEIEDPDLPIVRDWNEVAAPGTLREQWDWVRKIRNEMNVGGHDPRNPAKPVAMDHPFRAGYHAARALRSYMGLSETGPLPNLPENLHAGIQADLHLVEKNHLPGRGIQSLVGWKDSDIIVAGPLPKRFDSRRFLEARSLYLALFECERTERLVTEAHTWPQQASRAFAAELLAPQNALKTRVSADFADRTIIEDLAKEFEVGTAVIEKQLMNSGIELILD